MHVIDVVGVSLKPQDAVTEEPAKNESRTVEEGRALWRSERFRLLKGREVLALPSIDWIVPGLIPAQSKTLIHGPSDTYKTVTILDLGVAVASGQSWATFPVRRTPVVYSYAEGGQTGLRDRYDAVLKKRGIDDPDALPLYFVLQPPNLLTGDVDDFIHRLRPVRPGLVILDPQIEHMPGGDEDSTKTMSVFYAAADRLRRELQTAILVIQHDTKNERGRFRGSIHIFNAQDTVIRFTKSGPNTITLTCEKQRDAEKFAKIAFRLEGHGRSVVVCPIEQSAMLLQISDGAMQALQELDSLLSALGKATVTSGQWLKATHAEPSTFYEWTKALRSQGLVLKGAGARGKYGITEAGRESLRKSHARTTCGWASEAGGAKHSANRARQGGEGDSTRKAFEATSELQKSSSEARIGVANESPTSCPPLRGQTE